MFSFRYTFGACKHKKMILSYRMGQKLYFKLLFISSPNIDGLKRILSLLDLANNLSIQIYDLTTPKTCGYTIVKNNNFQK